MTAFAKGDFAQAWAWSDEPEKAKGEDEKASTSAGPDGAEKTASVDITIGATEETRKDLKKRR